MSSIRREKRLCLGVIEPRNNRGSAEAGKEREENSADLNDGEHCNHDLRNHWHEHADGVAFSETEAA